MSKDLLKTGFMKNEKTIVTPEATLSFPHLFSPSQTPGGDMKFSAVLLFDSDKDLTLLKKEAERVAKEKFGDKIPKNLRSPFRDGNEKSYAGYANTIFINCSSTQQPQVVDEKVQPIINPQEIYAGCKVRAALSAFAYNTAGNTGVSFGLRHIQKIDDGERISGGAPAEDIFESVSPPSDTSGLFGGGGDVSF